MSKQDSQFFNVFSLVIGILVAVALILMGIARAVGHNNQAQQVLEDATYLEALEANIRPHARVAVAGQDNSALAIVETKPSAVTVALAVPEDGPSLYKVACRSCHDQGIGGAPKMGDRAAWAPRIRAGKAQLYKHALEGFTGSAGVMPPKGGRIDLSDELIKQGVDYMVAQSQ
ncbi:MAG: c-type cytochrome [Steroidobacteraceae bacterium]|nr:c-type cytochrome [Steroidobacteraceae bacterium]MDW8258707.1 c-type cytochrome [Gammaproteobacteria bacterium]